MTNFGKIPLNKRKRHFNETGPSPLRFAETGPSSLRFAETGGRRSWKAGMMETQKSLQPQF